MTFLPSTYGAVGDGVHDDGPALNAMFGAALAAGEEQVIDWRGVWYVGETVVMKCAGECTIWAGSLKKLDGPVLDPILEIDLGGATWVRGLIRVQGRDTSWVANRECGDGVHVRNAHACHFDGFRVRHVGRNAVRNILGGNVINCAFGMIKTNFCGSPGRPQDSPQYKISSVATHIERTGGANSFGQRAVISLDLSTMHWMQKGAYLLLAEEHIVEVLEIGADQVTVWPWPGALEGNGSWSVDGITGAGLYLAGGNTSQSTSGPVISHYSGHALRVSGLYGHHCTGLTGEVVGAALTLSAFRATTWGVTVRGFHPEITTTDVLQADITPERCIIISPVVDLDESRVTWQRPTLADGTQLDWGGIRFDQLPEIS